VTCDFTLADCDCDFSNDFLAGAYMVKAANAASSAGKSFVSTFGSA
jgi:hypothetical protein